MFIVTKEIDSENISKLCRTCLREDGDKMVCLFVGPAGSSLAAKLRSLSCLEVWQGDGLPEKMCDRCVTRAESALLYREQCRAADRALRQAVLKVSGFASDGAAPGCKYYPQHQGFAPLRTSAGTSECVECGATFPSYQELRVHSGSHARFTQDDIAMQHMHIVEARNPCFDINFGHASSDSVDESARQAELAAAIGSDGARRISVDAQNRAACALHCSLCNRTFTNRTQLISHNVTHTADAIEAGCDNANVDVRENANRIPRNSSYERPLDPVGNSIQNLSYRRSTANDNSEARSLGFPESIDPAEESGREDGGPQRVLETKIHESDSYDPADRRSIRFARNAARANEQDDADGYQSCPLNVDCRGQVGQDRFENSARAKRHECDLCCKTFSQKSKLSAHRLSHSGEQPFKCSSCEKAYSSRSKLNAHTRLHTRTNVHPCRVCEKVFAYPSYLREHLKSHEKESGPELAGAEKSRPFECVSCGKRFRLSKNLRAHERLHTGKGLLRCAVCDKAFSQNYNLKVHMRTHRASRPHKCEYCNKCFAQKGNLAEHSRIHTKAKPFECKICGKRFAQSSHLKNHEASHATVRQHQCRLCGKRFKLANHLKRHLILHSGTKSYKCPRCDQQFAQPFSLTRHLKRHESAA